MSCPYREDEYTCGDQCAAFGRHEGKFMCGVGRFSRSMTVAGPPSLREAIEREVEVAHKEVSSWWQNHQAYGKNKSDEAFSALLKNLLKAVGSPND